MSAPDKREERVRRTGLKVVAKLDQAVEAVSEFLAACNAAGHLDKGLDDGRRLLMEDMREYAGYLEARFRK